MSALGSTAVTNFTETAQDVHLQPACQNLPQDACKNNCQVVCQYVMHLANGVG